MSLSDASQTNQTSALEGQPGAPERQPDTTESQPGSSLSQPGNLCQPDLQLGTTLFEINST